MNNKKEFKKIKFQPKMVLETSLFQSESQTHYSPTQIKKINERNSLSILSPQISPIQKIHQLSQNDNFNENSNDNSFIEKENKSKQKELKPKRKRKQCLWRTIPYYCYRWGMTEEEILNELQTNKYLKKNKLN